MMLLEATLLLVTLQPQTVDIQSGVWALDFSKDGSELAIGAEDGNVRVRTIRTGKLRVFGKHDNWVHCVKFSPDGRLLASGSADCTIRIWNVATGRLVKKLEREKGAVWSIAFSPNGQIIASASADGAVELWSTTKWDKLMAEVQEDAMRSVAFSKDGRMLAAGGTKGNVYLFDATRFKKTKVLAGPAGAVELYFGEFLYSLHNQSGVVLQWDVKNGKIRHTEKTGQICSSIAIMEDVQKLLLSTKGSKVLVYDLLKWEVLDSIKGTGSIMAVAASPKGELIAFGDGESVRLVDMNPERK